MKTDGWKLAALAGVFTLGALPAFPSTGTAATADAENPYKIIWERNPFQLKPVPVAPPPDTKPPEPPSNIELTGITTFLGPKTAYFMVKDSKGVSTPRSFREGDRQDAIEVIQIDAIKGAVRIRNAGMESVLAFDTKKIPVGAAPVLNPIGVPGVPGAINRPPGLPGLPTGIGTPTQGGIGEQPAFQNLPGTGEGGLRTIPTRSVRVPPVVPGASLTPQFGAPQASVQPVQPDHPQLSIEAQTILIEANRLIQQNTRVIEPPLPPTPFSPQ